MTGVLCFSVRENQPLPENKMAKTKDQIDQILDAIFSRFEVRGETPNGLLIVHDRERNERRYLTRADLLAAVQGGTA